MHPKLADAVKGYAKELAEVTTTSTGVFITPLLKKLNEHIFNHLVQFQIELDDFHDALVTDSAPQPPVPPLSSSSSSSGIATTFSTSATTTTTMDAGSLETNSPSQSFPSAFHDPSGVLPSWKSSSSRMATTTNATSKHKTSGGVSDGPTATTATSSSSVTYPEKMTLTHYLHLQQIFPIPDVHQVSSMDTVFRFLLARLPSSSSSSTKARTATDTPSAITPEHAKVLQQVISDILHYIRFREMYDLNHILQDPYLNAQFNGRDVVELIPQAIKALESYDPQHKVTSPSSLFYASASPSSPFSSSSSFSSFKAYVALIKKVRSQLSGDALYTAWGTWVMGVDYTGHVVLYQKPKPELLSQLNKRWTFREQAYDKSLDHYWGRRREEGEGKRSVGRGKRKEESASSTMVPRGGGRSHNNGGCPRPDDEDETKQEMMFPVTPVGRLSPTTHTTLTSLKGKYGGGDADDHEDTNILGRLYLRGVEKGRRISRLLQRQAQRRLSGSVGRRGRGQVPSNAENEIPRSTSTSSSCTIKDTSGSIMCLVDVADVQANIFTSSKYKEVKHVFEMLSLFGQTYYPENMHQMIIINGSFLFRVVYNLVKAWLDPVTEKKIVIISSTNHYSVDDLIQEVDQVYLTSPIRVSSPFFPSSSDQIFPRASPLEEREEEERERTVGVEEERSRNKSSPPGDISTTAEETSCRLVNSTTIATSTRAGAGGTTSSIAPRLRALSTVELARKVLQNAASLLPPNTVEDSAFCRTHTSSRIKKDTKYYDLFHSLTKYLSKRWIPSWYGGELAVERISYHYGAILNVGWSPFPPPRHTPLVQSHSSSSASPSCTPPSPASPIVFHLPSPSSGGESWTSEKAGPTTTMAAPRVDEVTCIQYLTAQLASYLPPTSPISVLSPSSPLLALPPALSPSSSLLLLPNMNKEQQSEGDTALPHPLSFAFHHPRFLASKTEIQYWKSMESLMQHPRFSEALDAVLTFAPPEILPDTLLLPMLYYNHLHHQHHHSPTPTPSTPVKMWDQFCQEYLTGGGGNVHIGEVTDVECEVFDTFLSYKNGK